MNKSHKEKRDKLPASPDAAVVSNLGRRDALKSLFAGFTTLRLLSGRVTHSGQPEQRRNEVPSIDNTRNQLFDLGWRFHRGDAVDAENPGFDDSTWRSLDLPHDWSIEDLSSEPESNGGGALWGTSAEPLRYGPFDRYLSQGQRATGWTVGGTGWYRKHFSARLVEANSYIEVLFDGVYMNCDVWLNGHHLGFHPYGYTSFAYDLSSFLSHNSNNIIAVRVRNEGRNTRWYSGSGMYRHVWLNVTGMISVPLWGLYVYTQEVSAEHAHVVVAVEIANRTMLAGDLSVRVRIMDPQNKLVASREVLHHLEPSSRSSLEQSISISNPQLWSTLTPRLYHADVELVTNQQSVDKVGVPFGIRTLKADAERGFQINGHEVLLRGGCLHHANGLLGAAAIDRAEEHKVELMKANGFNAIRCSHNPPSPAFLNACDRIGVLVIDEAFDQWVVQKNPQDYHLDFKEWWRRDLDSMVRRDRNHPSVIFWSIGNEIPERANPEGVEIARQLVEEIRRLDRSRLITAAIPSFYEPGNHRPWKDSDRAFRYLDVSGYNYQWKEYEEDHARIPGRVMMGTESFPYQAFENWEMVQKHKYVIGDFVWAGMDYLGESGVGNTELISSDDESQEAGTVTAAPLSRDFPWFNAFCGDIDLTGEPKPQHYYRRVVWGVSKLEMAVQRPIPQGCRQVTSLWGWPDELPSWTWPGHEGMPLKVRVYSAGDHVRLLLNGKEIGVRPISRESRLRAEFDVPYAPGILRAITLAKGKPVAQLTFKTVGPPARLNLRADRNPIQGDRNDLAYVILEVLDAAGCRVPDACVPVTFNISGAGELAGGGTANPKDMQSFRQAHLKTFHGTCVAIVRGKGMKGWVNLSAHAKGLKPASLVIILT